MSDKFALQNNQYAFPYHYIPHFVGKDLPVRTRFLSWGLEYLCYMCHIRDLVVSLSPESILDVGCGDGYFLGVMCESIADRMGVDLSEQAIAFAHAFNPHIDFRCVDVAEVDRSFDVVTAIEVLEHVPDNRVAHFVTILSDRAAVGGHVVVSVPSDAAPVQSKHYRHYSERLLKTHLQSCENLELLTITRLISRRPLSYRFYKRVTRNRLWTAEFPHLGRYVWKQMWRHRVAPHDGTHIVAVLRRMS